MNRKSTILTAALVLLQLCSSLWALPTTAYEAEMAVTGWLKANPQPLDTVLGREVIRVETFTDNYGKPVYYIVYLEPSGFVIVSADDLIEPIIGFADDGTYDPSPENPLGALVTNDLNGRMAAVQRTFRLQAIVAEAPLSDTQRRWSFFISLAETSESGFSLMGWGRTPNVWIAPLVQSKWGQRQACDENCYNYYTPDNLPSGCVATAMAQLMRYYKHPTTGIGIHDFPIRVEGVEQTASTRGGDGNGGAYKWGQMVLEFDCNTTLALAQKQAIGALCYDAGISVNTDYTSEGSGALLYKAGDALLNTFQYGNAISGLNYDDSTETFRDLGSELKSMVNPNLDAGIPVILGIRNQWTDAGHAVLADGYGYSSSILYHHLNMGWPGSDDVWYNLPDIDTDPPYNVVEECIYNIFTSGSGEIISGSVTDAYDIPISGATVTATGQGTHTDKTNSKGIYALAKVDSQSTYTVSVTKSGYSFPSQDVRTGKSESGEPVSGNRWGINFKASLPSGGSMEDFETNDFSKFQWEHEGDSPWTTTSWENHSGNYSAQAGTIDDDGITTLRVIHDCISGNISFYRKVSSESVYDYLTFYIDEVEKDTWSGDEDWAKVSFPVEAGTRTFEWTYSKDLSDAEGDDTAWIDDIVFPIDPGPEPPPPPPPPEQSAVEDFETGDFRKFPWEHEGDSNWTTSSQKHSGNYSAQAGQIDDDESTTLRIMLDCTSGNITFYLKVSSEAYWDYLIFYINGEEKGRWSGEDDWVDVSFPVTEGRRTFEWTYSKDSSNTKGYDTVWIDDIVFPVECSSFPPLPPAPPPPPPDEQCAVEDFETNDFSKFPWEHKDLNWYVTDLDKHTGNYSAEAYIYWKEAWPGGSKATLLVTLDCISGNINFHCKVITDSGDYLIFYIDGEEKGRWSGLEDWAEVSFPVKEGKRTFQWTYSKVSRRSDDGVWIDDIVFPVDCSN